MPMKRAGLAVIDNAPFATIDQKTIRTKEYSMRNMRSRWLGYTAGILSLIFAALFLGACSGGGGGGGGTGVTGSVVDDAIPDATITISLNAPADQSGAQVLGNTTSSSNGSFSLTVTFPNTSQPVFATAQKGTVVLSSYLGPSNVLANLGTISSTNVPDMTLSQVTTAALSILAATNQLSLLTPSIYASLLSNHRSDIIAAAAAIMSVVDAGCHLPTGDNDTFEMARNLVSNTSATGNTSESSLQSIAQTFSTTSCPVATLQNLLQAIAASEIWAPQLDLGDVVENTSPVVPVGTYSLQGLLADTGIPEQAPANTAGSAVAPEPISDTTVSVDSSGKITSTDGNVSGQVEGNFVTLSFQISGTTYSFEGKIGILPSGFLSLPAGATGEGFSIRAGGQNASSNGNLQKLDAVLVPRNATASWTGVPHSSSEGTSCSGGFGFRMHGLGPNVGGYMYPFCGTASSTGIALTTSNQTGEDDFNQSTTVTFTPNPLNLSELVSGSTTYSFILSTPDTTGLGGETGGTLYYVMGADEMIYTFGTSPSLTSTTFFMNENALDKLAESEDNQDH